jgi:uncharacterized protein YcbX
MTANLTSIYRYPVKGLSAETLDSVGLTTGEGLPHDRRFAIARGNIGFDRENPSWLRKTNFYMLMRDESLARLRTGFNEISGVLTVSQDGIEVAKADITNAAGRQAMERFFAEFLGAESLDVSPHILEAPNHMFGDASRKDGADTDKYVSLIGQASIRDLEKQTDNPVDPIRFRANLYMEGSAPWEEFTWVGKTISIGTARLRVLSRTVRCAATQVNPATAERDLNVPKALQRAFGHIDMGVYAEVIEGGDLKVGDAITPAG